MSNTLSSQSFATLFRHSKLAAVTYQGSAIAPHVIRTGETLKTKGEWGLKHTLPSDLRPSTVLVSSLDAPSTKAPVFRTATKDVAQLDRFNALFGAF
ncbi:hypothetical protein HDU98_003725, partial [Podochytrium sp. JEL0797]